MGSVGLGISVSYLKNPYDPHIVAANHNFGRLVCVGIISMTKD